jgi:hypothetical protein
VVTGRPAGSTNIPWPAIVAKLRQHEGRWLLLPEMANVSDRTIQVIRRRERRALRLEDGRIQCRRKATVWTDAGVRCTLYLRFKPKKETS